jgi:hypothetical protein
MGGKEKLNKDYKIKYKVIISKINLIDRSLFPILIFYTYNPLHLLPFYSLPYFAPLAHSRNGSQPLCCCT